MTKDKKHPQTQTQPDSERDRMKQKNLESLAENRSGKGQMDMPPMIGKYLIKKSLGQGGMGKVYLGRDPHLQRAVAIKVIDQELVNREDYLKRFKSEAKLASNLDHPNVVTIYDYDPGQIYGFPYIVMEYVKGGDVARKIFDTGGLDIRFAISITIGVAKALVAANENKIVHRDIKPKNILLTEAGEPKLTDLGIAKHLNSTTIGLTQHGSSPGTPDYMAPEQGGNNSVDIRTDIYSLGLSFYEMITSDSSFKKICYRDVEKRRGIIQETFNRHRSRLKSNNSSLLKTIQTIILKMTEESSGDRYQSPQELLADLVVLDCNHPRIMGRRLASPKKFFLIGLLTLSSILGIMGLMHFIPNGDDQKPDNGNTVSDMDKIRQTILMVRDVNKRVEDLTKDEDHWSSWPLILTFLPYRHLNNRVDPTVVESIWNDELFSTIQEQTELPIVDRESLEYLLRERELSDPNFTDPEALLQVRKFLPASILLKGTVRSQPAKPVFQIKLIDVHTSEVIALVKGRMPSMKDDTHMLYSSFAHEIDHHIQKYFSVKGKITAVKEKHCEVNIGKYHRLKKATILQIYRPAVKASGKVAPSAQVGIARVTKLSKFDARIELLEQTENVKPNMLVMEKSP